MNFAVMGKVSVVRWLLRRGADPNAIDRTPVGVRSVDEEGRVVSEEAPRPRLMTVLMGAAISGKVGVVRILIEAGADVNARDADGLTPLMAAVVQDHAAIVELLLKRGAEVNARDGRGRTALALATELEREKCIPVLVSAGGMS